MPDFTTEVFYHCSSAENFETEVTGSKGDKYIVRYDTFSHIIRSVTNRREVLQDYSCSCMAYKTKKGYCKHIKQVIASKRHCKWMQYTDGDNVIRKDRETFCPKCGLPAHALRYAV